MRSTGGCGMAVCRLRRVRSVLVGLTGLVAALSCGGPPAGPAELPPSLTILSPTEILRVGESVDVRLQAVFSDGRTTLITPLWGTDRPDIIHVKPLSATRQGELGDAPEQKTGVVDHMLYARVTGLAPGEAMVIADSRYGSCSRPVRVVAP